MYEYESIAFAMIFIHVQAELLSFPYIVNSLASIGYCCCMIFRRYYCGLFLDHQTKTMRIKIEQKKKAKRKDRLFTFQKAAYIAFSCRQTQRTRLFANDIHILRIFPDDLCFDFCRLFRQIRGHYHWFNIIPYRILSGQ